MELQMWMLSPYTELASRFQPQLQPVASYLVYSHEISLNVTLFL